MNNLEYIILCLSIQRCNFFLEKKIDTNSVYILDFYNIYCNLVKFDKYKTFSKKTFFICINILFSIFKDTDRVIIVSKNIFEVTINDILDALKDYKNITYVLVEDTHIIRSKNKERDDYACILIYNFLKLKNKTVSVVTNDLYRNKYLLLHTTKPFCMRIISHKGVSDIPINSEMIKKYSGIFSEVSVDRIGFDFTIKK
jgi:hypothetical protein